MESSTRKRWEISRLPVTPGKSHSRAHVQPKIPNRFLCFPKFTFIFISHARAHTRALVARVHPLSAVHSHINSKFILALGNLAASRTSACAWREKSVVTRTLIREHQAKKAPRECRNPQTHLRERTRDRPLFIVRPWRKVSRASFYTPGREVSTSPLRDGGRFPYRREISLHDRSINSLVTTSLQ